MDLWEVSAHLYFLHNNGQTTLYYTMTSFGHPNMKKTLSWGKSTKAGQVLVFLPRDKRLKELGFLDFFSKFHLNVCKTALEKLQS